MTKDTAVEAGSANYDNDPLPKEIIEATTLDESTFSLERAVEVLGSIFGSEAVEGLPEDTVITILTKFPELSWQRGQNITGLWYFLPSAYRLIGGEELASVAANENKKPAGYQKWFNGISSDIRGVLTIQDLIGEQADPEATDEDDSASESVESDADRLANAAVEAGTRAVAVARTEHSPTASNQDPSGLGSLFRGLSNSLAGYNRLGENIRVTRIFREPIQGVLVAKDDADEEALSALRTLDTLADIKHFHGSTSSITKNNDALVAAMTADALRSVDPESLTEIELNALYSDTRTILERIRISLNHFKLQDDAGVKLAAERLMETLDGRMLKGTQPRLGASSRSKQYTWQ